MGIERRCDASHQEVSEPIVNDRHGAVGDETFDPREIDDHRSWPCNRDTRGSIEERTSLVGHSFVPRVEQRHAK
jgi:hypothetical protein